MNRHEPAPGDESLVQIGGFASEIEANLVAAGLRDRGIECRVIGGATAGFRAEAPGAALILVHADRADDARAAIEEIRAEVRVIDWDRVDVGEPEAE